MPLPQPLFDRHVVSLRLFEPARFHLNHGGVIRGLLAQAIEQHELPPGLIPFACESGRPQVDAGEQYRIGLTLVGDARGLIGKISAGLERVGADRRLASHATLGGNFEVLNTLALPQPDLPTLLDRLVGAGNVTLRFVSPLRLERPKALKTDRHRYLNADCFPADHFLTRTLQRIVLVTTGRYPDQAETAALVPPFGATPPETRNAAGLWLDLPVDSAAARRDPTRPKGYTLGGFLGTVAFDDVPPEWMQVLLLGRFLHVGESTAYGFGRYLLCADEVADLDVERFGPAMSMLDRVANVDRLSTALDHVLSRSEAAGLDGVSPDEFAMRRYAELSTLALELIRRQYQPQALKGALLPKADGKLRPIAYSSVRDRVVQRAAATELAAAVETLLDDCSFGYRKGLSRQAAARAVERAWDEGYRYVLDADISAFFDTVDWKRLFAKLHALWPFEPLVEIIKQWVRLPVVFDGRRLDRERGLPQGLPVSPILANLFLDELDEELLGEDFRLVRYADDFIVLCRDAEAAHRARDAARASLADLGLTLNETKTEVAAIDAGFTYLGYLFCRSLVSEPERDDTPMTPRLRPDAIPKHSWLAQVPFERVEALTDRLRPRQKPVPPAPATVVSLAERAPQDQGFGRPLYLSSRDTSVSLTRESVRIERTGAAPFETPIRLLSHVVVIGRARVTVPVLIALGRFGVPVYFCRTGGELAGSFVPVAPDWPLWEAQARRGGDPSARLLFARSIVAAKLHNQATLVRRFHLPDARAVGADIDALIDELPGVQEVDALMGYEGRGAARYFDAVRASLDRSWRFAGRRKNPPPDPVNSMLSFGYTLLHNHVSTETIIAGLNPRMGLLHQGRGKHHALASDLMEPFRHVIDGLVWAMINRGEVNVTDFIGVEAERCLMAPDFRNTFIRRLVTRLLTLQATSGDEGLTYREAIHDAVKKYAAFVAARASGFEAFRVDRRSS